MGFSFGGTFFSALMLSACLLSASAPASTAVSATRKIVRTQDDLPRFTYRIPGSATELLTSDDAGFNAFAAKVGADVERVLADYDIADRATLRELLDARLNLQVLRHQDSAALQTIARIRQLEDKPDARLLSGLRVEALLRARGATGNERGPAYRSAYAKFYADSLRALPWAVVGSSIKRAKSNARTQSEQVMLASVKTYIEPGVAKTRSLGSDLAREALYARLTLRELLPLAPETLKVLTDYSRTHDVKKPDIWAARDVALAADEKLTPVNVAIWDEGTDLSLFPGRVYTDPRPDPRFDPHGLAFDIGFNPSHGELIPLTADQARHYPERLTDLEGRSDLEASIDSPAADAFQSKIVRLAADEVPALIEELTFFGYYAHGTHVAGIAARGNPAIRLAVARQNWDWRIIPAVPTEALLKRQTAAYKTYVDWFRSRGIRVVNMSWANSPTADYERAMERNGIGKTAQERQAMARHLFNMDRDGLLKALKSAPEILFVCAAGNSDSDNGFTEAIPSSFELPNLIAVGATDQAGDETSFTSYGKTVLVHASGYRVESFYPGGAKLRLSGTSMAAPAVVNLAAKLLALNPDLTPPELKRLIVAGSTASSDGRRHNINPRRSIELLRAQAGGKH